MATALITGASAGIGMPFAEELAARQTNLVLVARKEAKLQQLAQQLQNKYKIQIDVVVKDLTEAVAALAVFDTVTQKGLTIDLLINNAGFGEYGDFADLAVLVTAASVPERSVRQTSTQEGQTDGKGGVSPAHYLGRWRL